jgi:hypothetical protein
VKAGDSHFEVGKELSVISEVIRYVVSLEEVLYLLVGALSTFQQRDVLD